MHAKNQKTRLIGGISVLIIVIVALLTTSPSYAGTGSPFLGDWYGTDADGSDIRMVIAGNPAGPFQITSTDSYISFCHGGAGIITGTASLNPENNFGLEANMKVVCFWTGDTLEFGTSFVYNYSLDTLDGMSVTWYRASAHAPACIFPAMGLTGWWPGDGNAEDIVAHRTGTFMGDATTGPGLVDKAFLLDGNDDYIEVPDDSALNFGTGDFTIDLWVNFNDLSGEQVLMEKWIQGYPISQGWTLTKVADRNVYFVMDNGSGGEWLVGGELEIEPHTWHLIAVTRQGAAVTLYMDGIAIYSSDFDSLNLDAPISLKIGRREGGQGFYLNGRIDEVEIYNGTALTQNQIFELYTAGRLGKCKNYIYGPGIRAHPAWDNVDAWWWPEDRTLTLTIDDPNTRKNPDVKMKKSGGDKYAGTVWFELAGYDLKSGDFITLTDGLLTKTLVVSTLTITSVDVELDRVYGFAEPNAALRLPYTSEGISITSDSDGNWFADLGGYGYDIQPGETMIAEEYENDGDLTSFEFWIPSEP
jgi:hypothetical protein